MNTFNIYLAGVGGQGIGLISEIMLRAADHAGLNALGVDTHGLAQRGGIVSSHIRIGDNIHSPLVSKHSANLVISLERHEALRAAADYLGSGGTLVYYDTSWQPLPVRLKKAAEIKAEQLEEYCRKGSFKLYAVHHADLPDPRMQNIALLAEVCKNRLVSSLTADNYRAAMHDLMSGGMLQSNIELFDRLLDK
ncbi:MAG: pyruvate ferredoxin oxidoreductase [Candidatus Riflebacteria bacterium HGW-Riflebacteria-2]|jgi:indolepyruvate ferredoxin oxidoreductase beta subunit|nr:MAG: pyruvate ferredoxin oxidoreductase [Candidatus Riflebacteria bacterium HGW-Riflebacteria-2]